MSANLKKKINILIIDDCPRTRQMIAWDIEEMSTCGEIYTAASEEEAYQLLYLKEIDIALLDIMLLPGDSVPEKENIGGIKILKFIKNNNTFKKIMCVMLTNLDGTEIANAAIESGAYDYCTKGQTDEEIKKFQEVIMSAINTVKESKNE